MATQKELLEGYRRAIRKHIENVEREMGAMKFTLDAMVTAEPEKPWTDCDSGTCHHLECHHGGDQR
jgi:hypothetical protein